MDFDFTGVRDRVRFLHCLIGLFQQSTGVAKKETSGVRQADRLRPALEQLHAELLFEIANLPAQRGLRHVQRCFAARETFSISATATK